MGLKDSAVFVVAGVCAATLLFSYNFMLPVFTKVQDNRIEDLTGEVKVLAERIKVAEEDSKKLQARLLEVTAHTVFSGGNPYPVVLSNIRLCDSIERIRNMYGDKAVDQGAFFQVTLDENPSFGAVGYGYGKVTRRVESVMVVFKHVGSIKPYQRSDETVQQMAVLRAVQDVFPDSKFARSDDSDSYHYSANVDGGLKISISPDIYRVSFQDRAAGCK